MADSSNKVNITSACANPGLVPAQDDWRNRAFRAVWPIAILVLGYAAWSAADWVGRTSALLSAALLTGALACVWGHPLPRSRALSRLADILVVCAGLAGLPPGLALVTAWGDARGVVLLQEALFWAPVLAGYLGIVFHGQPIVVLLLGETIYALLYSGNSAVLHLTGQPLITQGALGYFAQPAIVGTISVVFGQVQGAVDSARRQARLAEHLAEADALTGLANRRRFRQDLALALGDRRAQPVSLVLIDLDHFKQINDRYDHQKGDEVLKHFARTARLTLRESDHLYRWGGEEFVLMLGGTGLQVAADLAERLRGRIAAERFPIPQTVTISLGVAQFVQGESPDALFERTDAALYEAKATGRNRVQCAEPVAQIRIA
ncbi:MAG: GGDEF domain-containing protein [Rhodocyclaceae bacterium]|jgi:diguanylate cyclase (GGDEF)-like protein